MNSALLALIRKDFLLELRQQYTFFGVLLYVASTIFVLYLIQGQPEARVWNALFWMVLLFVSINAVARSFLADPPGRMIYYFTLASPSMYIMAKMIFNLGLMAVMSLLSVCLFILLLGNPTLSVWTFIWIAVAGGSGLSLVFTFLAAIAAKARQQTALMAIMGFPILVPQLLIIQKLSSFAFSSALIGEWRTLAALLTGLDAAVFLLALILFPFLWKE